jgi:Flp pilus assembly CpaF family ATPase
MDRSTQAHAIQLLRETLKPVEALLDDHDIQEIMINGPSDVWVERRGLIVKEPCQITDIDIRSAITVLASLEGKQAKEGSIDGIIDSRMEGMRVAAVLSPTAVFGHAMSIRKHNKQKLVLEDYVTSGAFDMAVEDEVEVDDKFILPEVKCADDLALVLKKIVKGRKNIIVAGGTSSGKTTLLNAMLSEIDGQDRVLTIEDTPEVDVRVPNWVSLESNEQEGVTTRHLLRLALRFRPDRIIVGEVRGGEAYDLLQAANTGHDGCFSTVHANSAFAVLSRLETLVLTSGIQWPHEAIRTQLAETFNYIIFMARSHGKRQLQEIIELQGYDSVNGRYIYRHIFKRR